MMTFRTPFNELFGPFDQVFENAAQNAPEAWSWSRFAPAADVHADEDAYFIELDVPGLESKDIAVTVEDSVLTLSGERKAPSTAGYTRLERGYGRFNRTFRLPRDADQGRIEAVCKNGGLTV